MPVSHKHKTIFVHIPKCGGTSIETALKINGLDNKGGEKPSENILFGVENNKALHHLTASEIKQKIGEEKFNNYFKFTFVRNPYDKMISEYFWKLRIGFANLPAGRQVTNLIQIYQYYKLTHGKINQKEFEKFVINYAKPRVLGHVTDLHSDHFLPQSNFIYKDNKILVDFVGRFENLENDWQRISQKIGLKIKLPHANKTQHRDYKKYYTEETKKIVKELYQKDLENFNYQF